MTTFLLKMCYSPKFILLQDTCGGIFSPNQKFLKVPCGKCDDCRVSRSKEWAIRCLCEYQALSQDEQNKAWFLTLTYDDLHNPFILNPDDVTRFLKRLRIYFKGCKIKYFYCGEYGTKTYRPHYHFIIYGLPINDLELIKHNSFGDCIFDSPTISKIWGNGMVAIGSLSLKSCSYVARYSLKKNTTDCYQRVSQGFGLNFFKKYKKDIIQNGYLTVGLGTHVLKANLPRYFCKKIRLELGEKRYVKWLQNRQRFFKNNDKRLEKWFNTTSDLTFNDIYLGRDSKTQVINLANKKLINQALFDLYKSRDNF